MLIDETTPQVPLNRREIRARVMQAVYACSTSEDKPQTTYDLVLKDTEKEVIELEQAKGIQGDLKLMQTLFFQTLQNREKYDEMLKQKAANWNLERIAKIDRILMQMAICEVLNFDDIPVRVSLNEYLELAKMYSTPESNRFINGILDNLFQDFKSKGYITKD